MYFNIIIVYLKLNFINNILKIKYIFVLFFIYLICFLNFILKKKKIYIYIYIYIDFIL